VNAILCAMLLLPLAGTAGCDGAGEARGGLVARVNGAEIMLHELGTEAPAPGAAQRTAREALEKEIDRELLVQQALEAGLDRDPAVARAMEAARREALARAWLERAAAGARASAEEVAAFYAENPALFAKRRIYKLREITVAGVAPEALERLRAEALAAPGERADLERLAAALRWRDMKVSAVTEATQPAEELPLAYLPTLERMAEGEIAVLPAPVGATVVQLVHAHEAPLSAREAGPLIGRFLSGRKRLALAAAEVERLRAQAAIEYLGEFKR